MADISIEELVSHFYNEVPASRSQAIQRALQTDAHLQDMYQSFKDTLQELSNVSYSPRKESIEKILEYGQSS
jgi:phage tail tape-measure protein